MKATGALVLASGWCVLAAMLASPAAEARDLGREVLGANDGWAALGDGTTGGALATSENVYVARNRRELVAALYDGEYPPTSVGSPSNIPKIIYVEGTIDANVDDDNQPLACEDYYRNGFTLDAFLETYHPDVWGRTAPTGPLEDARVVSRNTQQARVRIRPGSNTTIVGVGKHATIRGAWIDIRGTAGIEGSRTNIIIRNITFEDTHDCFPQWSPTDGALGSWNSLYDSISIREADHVWIDHNTFRNVDTADHLLPHHFGVLYQVHDGHLDITNASDLVTVSWNRFLDHDKVMLIGSSDGATADRGKLRVTLHHNLFQNTGQRTPRVRFGQVHVYNNYYRLQDAPVFQYAWGVGIESAVVAQNNAFKTDGNISPDRFIQRFNGTAIDESGTHVDGTHNLVDILAAYNAVNVPTLGSDVGWTPTLHTGLDPTRDVPRIVQQGTGPFAW